MSARGRASVSEGVYFCHSKAVQLPLDAMQTTRAKINNQYGVPTKSLVVTGAKMTRTGKKPMFLPTISESSRAAVLEFSARSQTQDNPEFRRNDQMLAQEWALDGADASQRNDAAGGSHVATFLGLREGHSSPGLANQVQPSKIRLRK